METKVMLEKILTQGTLSPAEQIEVLSLVRAEHIDINKLQWLLRKDFLTVEQKIELLQKLVSEKTQKILWEEYLIASLGVNEQVDVTLSSAQCTDPDTNIRKFLTILRARDIQVNSDFPRYNERYQGTTRVRFRV